MTPETESNGLQHPSALIENIYSRSMDGPITGYELIQMMKIMYGDDLKIPLLKYGACSLSERETKWVVCWREKTDRYIYSIGSVSRLWKLTDGSPPYIGTLSSTGSEIGFSAENEVMYKLVAQNSAYFQQLAKVWNGTVNNLIDKLQDKRLAQWKRNKHAFLRLNSSAILAARYLNLDTNQLETGKVAGYFSTDHTLRIYLAGDYYTLAPDEPVQAWWVVA